MIGTYMETVKIKKEFTADGVQIKKGRLAEKVVFSGGKIMYILTLFKNGDDVFTKDRKKFTRKLEKNEAFDTIYLEPEEIEQYLWK